MPRKKAAPKAAVVEPAEGEDGGLEAYELQKSVVARLSRVALPADVKLQKEVPIALVKGSTVFISYLAALAHDTATERNHKTINATHVLDSVKQLMWDDGDELHKVLKKELAAFRANNEARKQGKAAAPPAPKPAQLVKSSASTSTSTLLPSAADASSSAMPIDVDSLGGEGATLLQDDRPNAEEEELYPEPDAEGEDNTGLEEYVEEDEEDEEMDEQGSEGAPEEEDSGALGGGGGAGGGLGELAEYGMGGTVGSGYEFGGVDPSLMGLQDGSEYVQG